MPRDGRPSGGRWRDGIAPTVILTPSDSDGNVPELKGPTLLREIKVRPPDLPVMIIVATPPSLGRAMLGKEPLGDVGHGRNASIAISLRFR
jgi:hypothetical protein